MIWSQGAAILLPPLFNQIRREREKTRMMQPSHKLYRLAANRLERLQTSVPDGEFLFLHGYRPEWCFTYLPSPRGQGNGVSCALTLQIILGNLDVALDHTPDMPYLRYHRKANETLMRAAPTTTFASIFGRGEERGERCR